MTLHDIFLACGTHEICLWSLEDYSKLNTIDLELDGFINQLILTADNTFLIAGNI